MHVLRLIPVVLLAAALMACGEDERPPTQSPPGAEPVTGRERIGWTQAARTADEVSQYRYLIYVNGSPAPLGAASCSPAAGGLFDCSAPLPPLSPGRYTLELAAVVEVNGTTLESPRSAPLQITVGSATVSEPGRPPRDGLRVSSDGLRIETRTLAAGLLEPVDLAVDREGRVFVAERNGTIRIVAPQEGGAPAAQDGQNIFAIGRDADPALLSIALGPDFAPGGHVYAAFTVPARDGHMLHVARLREAGGRLGEMAVTASHDVPEGAAVTIRFGPDRHLYVAVSSGRDARGAQDPVSTAGKILRLAQDGRIPEGSPWGSAVHSVGHGEPRGLAWHPSTGALFVVERDDAGDELNEVRQGANYGWPLVRRSARHPFVTPATLVLPGDTGSSGLTAVHAPLSPLHGDLIVAAAGAADLVRVRLHSGAQPHVGGTLLDGAYGRVAAVASGPDGAVYFVTGNEASRVPSDLLVRLTALPPVDLP